MSKLNQVVRRAMQTVPFSLRDLARASGLSPQLLSFLVRGERNVTPAVALRLARVLERWGKDCQKAATRIRAAAKPRGTR